MAKWEVPLTDGNDEISPDELAEAQKIYYAGRGRMRQLQERMPQSISGRNFLIDIECRDFDSVKLTWEARSQSITGYKVEITRITGYVDPDNFQGAEAVMTTTGDGTCVDHDVGEGGVYIYHLVFFSENLSLGVEEYTIPYTIPLSLDKLAALAALVDSSLHSPAERAKAEFEQFAEFDETIDEMERSAISKLGKKYSGDELKYKTARLTAFFRSLRQKHQ